MTPFVQHTFVQQFPIVQQFFDEFMFRGNNELIRKIFNSKIGKNEQKWFFQKWIFKELLATYTSGIKKSTIIQP